MSLRNKQEQINDAILSMQHSLDVNNRFLDYYKEALIRLILPQKFSLTLVYKMQNNIPYIKGRVYWDNKQREVQIGSVINVISQIKSLCKNGLMEPIKGLRKINIQWEDIKSNKELEYAVKYLGKIKFRQYLAKHFKFHAKNPNSAKQLQADFINDDGKSNTEDNIQNLMNPKDWYSLWRKDNL